LFYLLDYGYGLNFFWALLFFCLSLFLIILGALYFFIYLGLNYQFTTKTLSVKSGPFQITFPLTEIELRKSTQLSKKKPSTNLHLNWGSPKQIISLEIKGRIYSLWPKHKIEFLRHLYSLQHPDSPHPTSHQTTITISYPLKNYLAALADPVYAGLLALDFVLLWLAFAYFMWSLDVLPRYTVLRYHITTGIDHLGDKYQLLYDLGLLGILGLCLGIISLFLFRKERLAAYLCLGLYPWCLLGASINLYSLIKVAG